MVLDVMEGEGEGVFEPFDPAANAMLSYSWTDSVHCYCIFGKNVPNVFFLEKGLIE